MRTFFREFCRPAVLGMSLTTALLGLALPLQYLQRCRIPGRDRIIEDAFVSHV